MPRQISALPDQPLTNGVTIVCTACDADDQFAADDLRQNLADRGIPTSGSLRIVLQRLASHPDPTFTDAMKPEGYTIAFADNTLTLTGATPEGVFYAAQTAGQLIERTLPDAHGAYTFVLHPATIHDWPAMRYRGLSDDQSRGPVNTLAFDKKLVRTLAAFKDNLYSPYFENTQQYDSNPLPAPPGGAMTAQQAQELVAYARHYHVLIVPEQEAFGHLHHDLVYEQYQPLAETPHGAVLAPGQSGSLDVISQMFTELAKIYPGPFLHVGADETVDLGLGQTKADVDDKGLGQVYLDFMQQIEQTLRPLHRRLLFWGDIAENSPDLLKAMPQSFKDNTIAIAWTYNPRPNGFARFLKPYTDAGFETWVSPGINNWSRVYPNYIYGLLNIQQFTRDGQAAGSTGQLNTLWNDDGEGLPSSNWYGILFGCAAAWQSGESSIPQFEQSYAQVFHADMTGKLNQAQIELMAAHALLKDQAKVGDASDGLFWIDPWSKDGQDIAAKVRPFNHELRMRAERALTLIAEARAAYPAPPQDVVYTPTNQLPSNPTSLRETDAIDALELGARRIDFIGEKFQLADEMSEDFAAAQADVLARQHPVPPPHPARRDTRAHAAHDLGDINGADGKLQDIKDGYSLLRDLYAQTWLRTTRPYALRPVLEHYDYTVGIWLARIDKVRSAQRQDGDTHTLPTPQDLEIPPPPTAQPSMPQ
jgi:hexosaminidase